MANEKREYGAKKKPLRVIADSDRAKAPALLIPMTSASHHDAAARHYDKAARHHRAAAKHSHVGNLEKAGHYAHLTYAHHIHAEQNAAEAAKAQVENFTG